jgi:hypothetical protein
MEFVLFVPEITPRLHFGEAAFHFAENTTFALACRVHAGIVSDREA